MTILALVLGGIGVVLLFGYAISPSIIIGRMFSRQGTWGAPEEKMLRQARRIGLTGVGFLVAAAVVLILRGPL